jgi:hypothetical protein
MGSEKEVGINVKLKRFQQILSKIIMTLTDKFRKETLLKFFNILVIQILLYGPKCWALTERQKSRLEARKIRFLGTVPRYKLVERRRNEDTRIRRKL